MTVKISQLSSGHEVKAIVVVEVRRSMLLPPKNTDGYVLPDPDKLPQRDPALSHAEPENREPRPENPGPGQEDRRRQGKGVGARRGDLRLGARENQVPSWPVEGGPGGAARRHGRLRGDHLAVYRHLPRGRHPRPLGLGAGPLLSRVLSVGRARAMAIGFPANRPAHGSLAGLTRPGPSCKRGTTSAPFATAVKSISATWPSP